MTLQEFIKEKKILVCEYKRFRNRVAHPDYNLAWTNDQWNNRMKGRTQLKDSEVFTLGYILETVRQEDREKELHTL